jgi:hypothetical protein
MKEERRKEDKGKMGYALGTKEGGRESSISTTAPYWQETSTPMTPYGEATKQKTAPTSKTS